MGARADRIREALSARFSPERLDIADDSGRHAHHAGRNGVQGEETHLTIVMVSAGFAGEGRVARSRLIHEALAAEFKTGLHALSLTLRAPGE